MRDPVLIQILDDVFEADSEETVLFALQRYAQERNLPTFGFTRFCWNTSCHQCIVRLRTQVGTARDHACQAPVEPGLCVESVPRVLHWPTRTKSHSQK